MSSLARQMEMLSALQTGILDEIACPECNLAAVSVSFTRPADHVFRTWFVCSNCGFECRVHNAERPHHFHEERIDSELQARDVELWKESICKA